MNLLEQAKHLPHGAEVILEWLGSGGQVVGKAEAQARADICLKCPLNVSSPFLTTAVAAAIKRHLEVKNGLGLRVDGEKRLGTCQACGCNLRLLCWLPLDKVLSEMTNDEREALRAAPRCWKLK